MTIEIPTSFRPHAKAKAKALLGSADAEQAKRILNQISEEEWKLDRAEWRRWMDGMRRKFNAK